MMKAVRLKGLKSSSSTERRPVLTERGRKKKMIGLDQKCLTKMHPNLYILTRTIKELQRKKWKMKSFWKHSKKKWEDFK